MFTKQTKTRGFTLLPSSALYEWECSIYRESVCVSWEACCEWEIVQKINVNFKCCRIDDDLPFLDEALYLFPGIKLQQGIKIDQ